VVTRFPNGADQTRLARLAVPVVLVISALTACSSSTPTAATPAELLAKAKTTVDAAPSMHFTLTSQDVPSGAGRLTEGEGIIARPPAFQGSLTVGIAGATAKIDVVSVDGSVYAKLPLAGFTKVDPASFGLNDPAGLVSPTTGVTTLLTQMTGVESKGQIRIGSEVLEQVHGKIPGALVASLLASADPATPVDATVAIAPDSGQLRRAVLVGPFFVAGSTSTFTIVLDRYGEKVSISAPAG